MPSKDEASRAKRGESPPSGLCPRGCPQKMSESSVGEIVLSVKEVSLTLGGNQILKNVSFDVVDRIRPGVCTGQVVALLGPSGVGKTRMIRIIAGLDAPDSGVVLGLKSTPVTAGAVGVVFQDYPLL